MSRVCEEFHLSVRQALVDLALEDWDEFDAETIADESAALMFEIMDLRAFAQAMRLYQQTEPEKQADLAREHPLVNLAMEIEFEIAGERLRARRQP